MVSLIWKLYCQNCGLDSKYSTADKFCITSCSLLRDCDNSCCVSSLFLINGPRTMQVHFVPLSSLTHQGSMSNNVLKRLFQGRLILLRGDLNWPARSVAWACSFWNFPYGLLKNEVYRYRPRTIDQQKHSRKKW